MGLSPEEGQEVAVQGHQKLKVPLVTWGARARPTVLSQVHAYGFQNSRGHNKRERVYVIT